MSGNGIFERPDSAYWWASWTNERGLQTRRSTKIKKIDDTRGLEAQKLRAMYMLQRPHIAAAVMQVSETWDEMVDAYLADIEQKLKPSTVKRYVMALKHLFPAFTGTNAATPRLSVKAYINDRTHMGAKPSTINKEIAFMQGCYSWAQLELSWEIENPWKGRTLKVDNVRNRYLTRDEADRLIQVARDNVGTPYMADFVLLAINTGMRPGELLNLSWDRVDLAQGIILFEKLADQKSGKRNSIPINAGARLALMSRLEYRNKKKLGSKFVFTDSRGHKMQSIKKGFQRVSELAGLQDLHPHDLRRTFASWLVQEGVSIQMVSGLLRHADIAITHAVYAHLAPDQYRDAAAVLDSPPRLTLLKNG